MANFIHIPRGILFIALFGWFSNVLNICLTFNWAGASWSWLRKLSPYCVCIVFFPPGCNTFLRIVFACSLQYFPPSRHQQQRLRFNNRTGCGKKLGASGIPANGGIVCIKQEGPPANAQFIEGASLVLDYFLGVQWSSHNIGDHTPPSWGCFITSFGTELEQWYAAITLRDLTCM